MPRTIPNAFVPCPFLPVIGPLRNTQRSHLFPERSERTDTAGVDGCVGSAANASPIDALGHTLDLILNRTIRARQHLRICAADRYASTEPGTTDQCELVPVGIELDLDSTTCSC